MSNAEAMFVGAEFDMDTDVIVSWLPLFHDMGMTGFLTVPMYFGAELVKVTPMDFLRDTLLWAKLIDKYKGTMTAAPNFAYALLAKRLRRQAQPGQFDLSSLRWALSGAEQVEPADVEDLIEAGGRSACGPRRSCLPMAWPKPLSRCRSRSAAAAWWSTRSTPICWPTLHRAVPATTGNTRRLATLGPLLAGLEARVVDEDGNVLPPRGVGVIEVRGEPVTTGYITQDGIIPAQDEQGWYDTGDLGYLTEDGHMVVCGRVKDVIIMAGRNIYPTDIERAAGRVAGVRPGCAVAVRLDAGQSRESFAVAVESNAYQDTAEVRRIKRQVAHEVVADVDVRPRNVVVLGPGRDPEDAVGQAASRTFVGPSGLILRVEQVVSRPHVASRNAAARCIGNARVHRRRLRRTTTADRCPCALGLRLDVGRHPARRPDRGADRGTAATGRRAAASSRAAGGAAADRPDSRPPRAGREGTRGRRRRRGDTHGCRREA